MWCEVADLEKILAVIYTPELFSSFLSFSLRHLIQFLGTLGLIRAVEAFP